MYVCIYVVKTTGRIPLPTPRLPTTSYMNSSITRRKKLTVCAVWQPFAGSALTRSFFVFLPVIYTHTLPTHAWCTSAHC